MLDYHRRGQRHLISRLREKSSGPDGQQSQMAHDDRLDVQRALSPQAEGQTACKEFYIVA